jgi:HSP20 family protein
MALVRWDPTRELSSLQSEMNRLFSTFFDSPASTGSTGNGQSAARRWYPAMDLVESDDHFVLRVDLPGLSEDDVKIEVENDTLVVSGERKETHEQKREGFYRLERSMGAFSRSLSLPEGIDADQVSASFDRGVLEVRIPKPEQRKPRRVEISVGGQQKTLEGATA